MPLLMQRRLVESASIGWRGWLGFFAMSPPSICRGTPRSAGSGRSSCATSSGQHNVERFVEPFDHVRPCGSMCRILLFGLLPTMMLAWPLGRFLTSTKTDDMNRRCLAMGYLLLRGYVRLLFLVGGSKLPTYILPAFRRCAWRWAASSRAPTGGVHAGPSLVAACWLLLACSHYMLIPQYAESRSPMARFDEVRRHVRIPRSCAFRAMSIGRIRAGRSDFRTYRSKDIGELATLDQQPRTWCCSGIAIRRRR